MREMLIELINKARDKYPNVPLVNGCKQDFAVFFADYLIDNGVVVLPEKVYWFDMGGNIKEAKRIDEFFAETEKGYGYQIAYSDIGKTVFLSREEAEKFLKGGAE